MFLDLKQTKAYATYKQRKKAFQRWLSLPFYMGSVYRCPVCEANLARFKPIWKSFPRMLREHGFVYPIESIETCNLAAYSCPACGSSDRERLYALYLNDRLAFTSQPKPALCIDFAPSPALSKKLRAYSWLHYRTADLYRPGVDDQVDIMDMACYQNESVDLFICSHVLEHVSDDQKAMRELYRVLKPDGFGIVMVPLVIGVDATHEDPTITDEGLRWKYFGQGDHVRLYGRRDFVMRLGEAGLLVHQLGVSHFGAERFRRSGIHDNSILYIVERR